VKEAKKKGISRVHGFFVIGSPGETAKDIIKTFRFAARLQLDTFGFNRLSVYRGTPLWKEYVDRAIIEDRRDWYKSFKCCDIDPTTLSTGRVNRLRMMGYALLFTCRIFGRPVQTWHLLQTFKRYMKMSAIVKLLSSPFRLQTLSRKAELPARMVDLGLEQPVRRVLSPTTLR
jgi:anaerobic magnesium-protoporphyrin IX monomethyl ester cyclase